MKKMQIVFCLDLGFDIFFNMANKMQLQYVTIHIKFASVNIKANVSPTSQFIRDPFTVAHYLCFLGYTMLKKI